MKNESAVLQKINGALDLKALRWISEIESAWSMEGVDDPYLKTYYVETPEYNAIRKQLKKFIVCGRKGSGKSAIKHLIEEGKSDANVILSLDFENVFTSEFLASYMHACNESHHISPDIFRFVFLVHLLKEMVNGGYVNGDEIVEDDAFLEQNGMVLVSLADLIKSKESTLKEAEVGVEIPVFKFSGKISLDTERKQIDWLDVPNPALLNDFEKYLIEKMRSIGKPVLILMDKVDVMRDDWESVYRQAIPALVQFLVNFNRKIQERISNGTKVVLFIRDDLWSTYCRGKTDFNKYEVDLMVKINWPKTPSTDNRLFNVIGKRIEFLIGKIEEKTGKPTSFRKPIISNVLENSPILDGDRIISSYSPPNQARMASIYPGFQGQVQSRGLMPKTRNEIDYSKILEKTQLRPRDFISYFRCAIEFDEYVDFQSAYSNYLYAEIKEEIKVPLLALGGSDLIEDILRDLLQDGSSNFLSSAFMTKYAVAMASIDASTIQRDALHDGRKVLETLFNSSVIGWKSGSECVYKYKDTTGSLKFNWLKESYLIHPGLKKYFSM